VITLRKSNERGQTKINWLKSWHTFSFGDYHDPCHVNFRSLRVINEDIIAPNQGFGTHPHKDMEIVTYIVSGALAHRDSMGNTHVVSAGGVQYMCAGTGVYHSEFNPSEVSDAHILQIWIKPTATGLPPACYDLSPLEIRKPNEPRLVVSPDGREGSLKINQNAFLYTFEVDEGFSMPLVVAQCPYFWLQLVEGEIGVGDICAQKGDGISGQIEDGLTVSAFKKSVFIIFGLH
jgi:redox-sensitive bicupin YhaK (pirin superfamily)